MVIESSHEKNITISNVIVMLACLNSCFQMHLLYICYKKLHSCICWKCIYIVYCLYICLPKIKNSICSFNAFCYFVCLLLCFLVLLKLFCFCCFVVVSIVALAARYCRGNAGGTPQSIVCRKQSNSCDKFAKQ